jgi:hypothetical protein
MVTLNRLPMSERNKTNSRHMRAFMQALLETSGLLAGQEFDLKAMLGNFKTHIDNGRFEPISQNKVRLTNVGREYFAERLYSGKVTREEVINMTINITSRSPLPDWEPVEIELV